MLRRALVTLALLCCSAGQLDYLPGSCRNAGFTGCCTNDTCAGVPASCFCDISCYEYDDCCSDMQEICPEQKPPKRPLYLIASNITFLTARLSWSVPNRANDTNYLVHYRPVTAAGSNMSVVLNETTSCLGAHFQSPCVLLKHLDIGTMYYFTVVAWNNLGTQSSEMSVFKTLTQGPVQQVHARTLNDSAVRVIWAPMWVPAGTSVLLYQVFSMNQGTTTAHGEFSANDVSVDIGNLDSERLHEFWVLSRVVEVDGSTLDSPPSDITSDSTVFVPETTLIQLRAGPFPLCSEWNLITEREVIVAMHSALVRALSGFCGCDYSESSVVDETLLCVTPDNDVIYRARIASTPDHTVSRFINSVEKWVNSQPTIPTTSTLEKTVFLDPKCPVKIRLRSEPVCESDGGSETCLNVSVLVVSLVAELMACLVALMLGVVVALCWSKRSKLRKVQDELRQSSEPNVYVSQLPSLPQTSTELQTSDT